MGARALSVAPVTLLAEGNRHEERRIRTDRPASDEHRPRGAVDRSEPE